MHRLVVCRKWNLVLPAEVVCRLDLVHRWTGFRGVGILRAKLSTLVIATVLLLRHLGTTGRLPSELAVLAGAPGVEGTALGDCS